MSAHSLTVCEYLQRWAHALFLFLSLYRYPHFMGKYICAIADFTRSFCNDGGWLNLRIYISTYVQCTYVWTMRIRADFLSQFLLVHHGFAPNRIQIGSAIPFKWEKAQKCPHLHIFLSQCLISAFSVCDNTAGQLFYSLTVLTYFFCHSA